MTKHAKEISEIKATNPTVFEKYPKLLDEFARIHAENPATLAEHFPYVLDQLPQIIAAIESQEELKEGLLNGQLKLDVDLRELYKNGKLSDDEIHEAGLVAAQRGKLRVTYPEKKVGMTIATMSRRFRNGEPYIASGHYHTNIPTYALPEYYSTVGLRIAVNYTGAYVDGSFVPKLKIATSDRYNELDIRDSKFDRSNGELISSAQDIFLFDGKEWVHKDYSAAVQGKDGNVVSTFFNKENISGADKDGRLVGKEVKKGKVEDFKRSSGFLSVPRDGKKIHPTRSHGHRVHPKANPFNKG